MSEFKSWDDYTPLERAAIDYSEYHKDVHGFRPRHCSEWTLEDYDREFKILSVEAEKVFQADRLRQVEAIEKFEKLVLDTIDQGAEDRATAINWIISGTFDDYDKAYIQGDSGYFNFEFGMPYQYDWRTGEFLKGSYDVFTQEVVK